jgi:hypothetical protein
MPRTPSDGAPYITPDRDRKHFGDRVARHFVELEHHEDGPLLQIHTIECRLQALEDLVRTIKTGGGRAQDPQK